MTLGATTAGAVTIGSDNADGLGVNVTALVQASDGGGTLLYAPTNYTAGSALTGFDGAISTVAGVLQANLTNSTTGIFGPASTLSVGGGDFQLINTTASTTKSQVLNGLTVNPGSSTIDVDNGSTSLTLDLRGSGGTDGITRNTGGTVNFIATAGSVGSTSIVYTDQANDAGGILGGWATVSGTTWATNNGGNIVVGLPTASYNTAALATGTSDVDVIGSATLGGNANTLRFNSAGVDALTISNTSALTDGGILVTANVGANISTISGGAIEGALGVDLVVDQFDTSAGLAISSTIADNTNPTALTKSGPGLLSLTNPANTYSGTTYINAGTLNIAAAGSLGSGAFELNGGTLQYTGGSAVNLTPGYTLTTAGGGFDSSGAGSLTISGNMTVSGASSTQGGAQLLTLTGSNNGGIGTLSGTINNGGGNSDYTAVTKTGAGEWVLSGANTYTGFTTITSGTLVAENVSALGNLNGTNVVNPALVVMNGGTLDIATDTSIDPYDVVMPVASTIVTDRLTPGSPGITQTLGYLAIGSNNLTVNAGSNVSGGTPMLAFGQVNLTGNPDIISNTANVTLANVQGTAAVGTTYTLTLTNNTGGLSYITGNISNGGSGGLVGLTKSGTGVLILDGTNTFTGPTSVTAGVLNVQNNEALGTGLGMSTSSVSVSNGGVLQLQGGITTAASVLLSLNGAGLTGALNGALESVSGNNTYTGPIFLAGTGISIGNDTAGTTLTLSNPGTMTTSNNGTLVLIGAGNITIDSNIGTGSGGVTDSSPGLLTLAGTGTYTGATALSSGTTTITGALGNTAVTVGAATLQLNNTSAINQNTLTVNNANSVVTETVGGIGGSAALAESNGLVTLSQSNSYTGATTLSGSGTLNINNAGALGATASTFNINGGTIDNTSGAAITLTANQPITLGGNFGYSTAAGTINNSINFGTGAVANSGSRTITLNGAGVLTFGGIMTNTAGAANTLTISLGNNTTSTSAVSFGGYALSNNGTSYIDVIGGRGNVDITGPVTNGGTSTASGLTWTGNGILTLSGSNTYGGATTIGGGGTVDLANQYAVQNSTVTMQPYGSALVFDSSVSGNAFTFGGLAAASNGPGYDIALQDNAITPDPVALTVGGNNASTVYAGYLSGGGSLTKVGTGNLTLTGVSTYAGATTVNGGTLQLGNGGTTGNIPGNLTMATGATLIDDQTGASDPIAGVFTPNGGALTVDTGTLVLNSTNIPDGTTNAFGYLTVAANTELVFDPATTSTNSFTGVTQGADTILSFEAGTNTLSGSYWPQSGPTALYLTGGILNISFILPYGGTYGYIGMAGGSMNNGISMGRPAGSYSVLDLSSGSINAPSGGGGVSITMSNNAVINQTGGSIINTNDGTVDVANTAGTTAVFNLSGGTVGQPASGGYYKLVVGNNAAATGIVNLDGGVFYAYSVAGLSSSLSSLNFNGGTLVAGNAGTFWNANEVPGYIYGGGATINDGGLSITIAQSLLAPTGDGVTGLPAISSSTGFIGSPVVVISGGSGSGATAVADFDSATGTITGLTITNPGTGYLPGDTLTVSLVGGTAVTGTTVLGMATLGANTSGGLTKTGAGVLTLSGTDSTYTGPTTVNAGTLEYTNDNALPLASSAIDVNNAGSALAVRFGGGSDFTAAQIASLLSSGTINFGANTAFGIDTTDASGIYSNILSMPVGLIKLGANILTLTGPNTYTGVTTLAGGELNVGVAENPGVSGPLGTDTAVGAIVLTGGTLQYSSANQYDYSARFSTGANQDYNVDTNSQAITWATALTSSGGELTKSGAGSLTLTGANTYTGATTLTTGTLTFAGAGTLPSGSGVNVGNGTLLRILNDGTGNNGTISLGNNVTAIGSVTSTINVGHNSANTGNTVALGTLSTGAATVGNATTFDFTGTNGYLVSFTNLLLPGVAGQGTTLNPTTTSVTILGNVTNQMTSQSGNNYDTLTLEGSTAGNAIDGVISDSAIYTGTVGGGDTRITVNGAGVTWALNGANTYHGPTTVSAGTLQLGNASALGNTSTVTVSSGAVLDLGGQTVTGTSPLTINGTGIATGGALINSSVTPASYAGSVALGSNSDIGGTGATTLNGVVSGGFSLTKVGSGTLTITSTGSYTGATNVLGGTLIVSGSLSGTSAVNLDPSTLEVDGAIKAGATISSTASTVEGTGIVGNITLTGASNLAPGLTSAGVVAGGTLSAANVVFSDTASSLSITLGQASADDSTLLALSGSASLNDTPLNLTLGGAFSGAQPGMVYTILTGLASSGMGSGTDAFTINGAVVDDGQSFADGLDTFSISYNDGTDVQLELTGVPEPGTWTMLIAGAGMLIAFQRKRRH
jgi:autotransporter-associated beta strand protein